jgi:hypothetical protein
MIKAKDQCRSTMVSFMTLPGRNQRFERLDTHAARINKELTTFEFFNRFTSITPCF